MSWQSLRGETAPHDATTAAVRPRLQLARRVAIVATAAGLIGQLLFYATAIGLNFALAVATALLAALLVRPRDAQFDPLDAWLPAVALVLAAFVALRGDPALLFLDVVAALGLSAAALAAIGGHPVTRRLLPGIGLLMGRVTSWTAFAGLRVAGDAAADLRPSAATRDRFGRARPILRGLLIALPMVIVFSALFASADAVFARLIGDAFDLHLDVSELAGRIVVAAVVGYVAAGALAFVAEAPAAEDPVLGDRFRFLGTPEALIVLLALDAVFALFVGFQAAYLFGGLDTLTASGLSYAEYARRGFFELLAVAALAGLLILALEAVVQRRARAYVAAAIGLMVLTGVVLASAVLRLRLYQEAYGWTELRFYALAAMVWLAIAIVLAIGALALDRSRWLVHGLVVAAAVAAIGVNVIGPVRFVTEQNVARVLDPSLVPPDGEARLDTSYLAGLGDDAIPVLVQALPMLPEPGRAAISLELQLRAAHLNGAASRAWQSWNLGRELARAALAAR